MRNNLYYIGAGLTKALELPDRPVPLMYDFVRVMAEYVYDDVVLTTLAELVNAQLLSTRSSTAEQLAGRVVGRSPDRSATTRDAFRMALQELPPESIEVLLERAGAATNLEAGGAELRFRYAINRVFVLIDERVNIVPLDRFLRGQLSLADTMHTLVNFNYDLVTDRLLQQFGRLWSVQSGYGFPVPYYSIRENIGATTDVTTVHDAEPFVGDLPSSVLLLKPHGSLNWLLPYRFRDDSWRYDGEPVVVPLTETGALRYTASTATFQHVALPNRERISNAQPLIISPTYSKLTDLQFLLDVRDQADRALRNADEVYILGWSMPATDIDHRKRIARVIAERSRPLGRLVLVSLNMKPEDVDRIKQTFGVSRVELHNDGFVSFVEKAS